ncbi:MAG: monovalent cation/H(+) antiporter subunit G [Roseomonas sp.]|jgi:multicomponent Na+:H+ antiporter subunit G|nr:monovalent cation/H(+) antiporter subunit G [Roseomonas sp.]
MSLLVSIFATIAVLAGAFFFIAGTLGLLRFGDTLSRVHALTKADNLGLGLIVLGLLPLADSITDALKLVVIWALVLLGGTTAAQLVASAVRRQQDPPS